MTQLEDQLATNVGNNFAANVACPNLFSSIAYNTELKEAESFKLICVMFCARSKVISFGATASSLQQCTNIVQMWVPSSTHTSTQRRNRANNFLPPPGERFQMSRPHVAEDFATGRHAVDDNNHSQYGIVIVLARRIGSRSWQMREFGMIFQLAETNSYNAFNYLYAG